jgi:hypothetical protein
VVSCDVLSPEVIINFFTQSSLIIENTKGKNSGIIRPEFYKRVK